MHMTRVLVCAALLSALAGNVQGHGGVSVEEDVCIMKLGDMRSHFTGYIPESRSTQEFCEDIPDTGNVIMVMDFMSDELRGMDVDFRIVRDVNKIGVTATWEDLGGPEAIDKASVYHLEPKKYPHGTLSARHRFDEAGMFIGIVTARDAEGQVRTSVFPFSVGRKTYWSYVVAMLLAVGVSVGLYRLATKGSAS